MYTYRHMDKNTLVGIVAIAAIIALVVYGSVALICNVDSVLTVTISGALAAIIASIATYLAVKPPEPSES